MLTSLLTAPNKIQFFFPKDSFLSKNIKNHNNLREKLCLLKISSPPPAQGFLALSEVDKDLMRGKTMNSA